jgi:hypothetical protein
MVMGLTRKLFGIILSSFILHSCAPAASPVLQTGFVTVYATFAAQPWLNELFVCANEQSVVLKIDAGQPEIHLRVGEPENLASPAYQIDEEEILIVAHPEGPVQNLTLEQAQALFAGQGDPSVQVWVFSAEEDVQMEFDRLVMQGRRVTSFANLAASPQHMSEILNAETNAAGVLPRRWKLETVRAVYSAGTVPVLAITKGPPTGAARELIACMQK